jgi:hypothetical protein
MAFVKHRISGNIAEVPDHYLTHPILGIDLIPIEDEVQAAPKKETKSPKEQPAPKTNNKENEE